MKRGTLLTLVERGFLLVSIAFVVGSGVFPISAQLIAQPVATIGTGFAPNATYPTTSRSDLPADVAVVGSWLGTDASTGDIRTRWHLVTPPAVVYVSGYPAGSGNQLTLESRCGRAVKSHAVISVNPRERWVAVPVEIDACESKLSEVRLHARDGSTAIGGWLASSDVLPISRPGLLIATLLDVARLIGCTALALTLVFGPGLALARRLEAFGSAAVIWMPGLSLLLFFGCIEWAARGNSIGHRSVVVLSAGTLAALTWRSFASRSALLEVSYAKILLLAALIATVATGRALYSLGPADELYGGTISRTFEPSDRSDARISYHVAQLVATGSNTYGQVAARLFAPYTFSDRGPIAGISAAAIIAIARAQPPASSPNEDWRPFDPQGFAAYRAALFVFASVVVLSLYGFVFRVAGLQSATFAASMLSLSPFILHETWFTWPKLLAAAFIMSAAYGIGCRRYVEAGISLGIGFLVHPSALFALPALFAYTCLNAGTLFQRVTFAIMLAIGPVLAFESWRIINGEHYTQSGFLNFVFQDAGNGPGPIAWGFMRGLSLANTIVPFWLPFIDANNHSINGWNGQQLSVLAHLDYAYWTTLPFGIGLTYVVFFVRTMNRAARKAWIPFLVIVVVPFCIFWIYWGSSSSGLLREGLHWWFVGLIAFVAVTLAPDGPYENRVSSFFRRLRAIEVVGLALFPAMVDNGRILSQAWPASDALGIILVIGASLALAYQTATAAGAGYDNLIAVDGTSAAASPTIA